MTILKFLRNCLIYILVFFVCAGLCGILEPFLNSLGYDLDDIQEATATVVDTEHVLHVRQGNPHWLVTVSIDGDTYRIKTDFNKKDCSYSHGDVVKVYTANGDKWEFSAGAACESVSSVVIKCTVMPIVLSPVLVCIIHFYKSLFMLFSKGGRKEPKC